MSSTFEDLKEHRKAASDALKRLSLQVGQMELFGARPQKPNSACFSEIKQCDLFVGIYAHRYGFIPPGSTQSITEQEFHYGRKLGKPAFCFLVDEDYEWPAQVVKNVQDASQLQKFKSTLLQDLVVEWFREPLDLAIKVVTAVARYFQQNRSLFDDPNNRRQDELISVLELRKEQILRDIDAMLDTKPWLYARHGIDISKNSVNSREELHRHLSKVRDLFWDLHEKNLEAIGKGQMLLSHEITSKIHALLWVNERDMFGEKDFFVWYCEPPAPRPEPPWRFLSYNGDEELKKSYPHQLPSIRNNSYKSFVAMIRAQLYSLELPSHSSYLDACCESIISGLLETYVYGQCPHCGKQYRDSVNSENSSAVVKCKRFLTRIKFVHKENFLGHRFKNGFCHKCGFGISSVQYFGWQCKKAEIEH